MTDRNCVRLNIFFARMNAFDAEGMTEIISTGFPDDFEYSSAGDVHRLHKANIRTEPEMLAFCDEIRILLNKYFPMGYLPCLHDVEESGE
jgi:hypothetical protein